MSSSERYNSNAGKTALIEDLGSIHSIYRVLSAAASAHRQARRVTFEGTLTVHQISRCG